MCRGKKRRGERRGGGGGGEREDLFLRGLLISTVEPE